MFRSRKNFRARPRSTASSGASISATIRALSRERRSGRAAGQAAGGVARGEQQARRPSRGGQVDQVEQGLVRRALVDVLQQRRPAVGGGDVGRLAVEDHGVGRLPPRPGPGGSCRRPPGPPAPGSRPASAARRPPRPIAWALEAPWTKLVAGMGGGPAEAQPKLPGHAPGSVRRSQNASSRPVRRAPCRGSSSPSSTACAQA